MKENKDSKIIHELLRVPGIGPVTARKFIEEGIRSLDDLKKNQNELNAQQKIGLMFKNFYL